VLVEQGESEAGMGAREEVFSVPTYSHLGNGKRVPAALFTPEGVPSPQPLYNPEGDRLVGPSTKPPLAPAKPALLRRPCMYLTRFIKSLPVIFISLVIAWSYYAYVVAVVLTTMTDSQVEQLVCLIVFHFVFLLFVWTYFMAVVTPPGKVPASWHLAKEDVERLAGARSEDEWKSILASQASQLGCKVKQRSVQAAIRYCEKCLCIKPDRCHHCSVCEQCTLKMDHHCPWINNCVGFHNYKYFILFLLYALSYCLTISATTARHFLTIWLFKEDSEGDSLQDRLGSAKYHVLFVFFVSILFSLSISSLFWYHIWLLWHNRSTLEQFRAPVFENNVSDPDGWSLGSLGNVREVFGENPLLWLLPVNTVMGDGIRFPSRTSTDTTTYHSIGNAEPRPETPNRTLINPVMRSGGQMEVTKTINCEPASDDCRITITEVRLDTNGHVKTVKLSETSETSGDQLGR